MCNIHMYKNNNNHILVHTRICISWPCIYNCKGALTRLDTHMCVDTDRHERIHIHNIYIPVNSVERKLVRGEFFFI